MLPAVQLAGDRRQLGRYELIARIGEGGMAEVQLARLRGAMGFEKLVVVKLVHDHLASQKSFVEMLMQEARLAALVKHPNVVDIYDLGESDGRYFVAMEYLAGEPLLAVLRAGRDGKRLDPFSTARLIAEVAEGLTAAHQLRSLTGEAMPLVHHDVSLGNIMVLYTGQAKLVDFGVAKAGENAQADKDRVKGKFGYMAPEKLRGEGGDARSDLFSLGVVLWEALTLRRLFRGNTDLEAIAQILEDPIAPPSQINSDVPKAFDPICLRALERDVARRYQTAAEMAKDIELVLKEASYSGKYEVIAQYMQATFADHIRARGQLIKEAATLHGPSEQLVSAAFAPGRLDRAQSKSEGSSPGMVVPPVPAAPVVADGPSPAPLPERSSASAAAEGVRARLVGKGKATATAADEETQQQQPIDADRAAASAASEAAAAGASPSASSSGAASAASGAASAAVPDAPAVASAAAGTPKTGAEAITAAALAAASEATATEVVADLTGEGAAAALAALATSTSATQPVRTLSAHSLAAEAAELASREGITTLSISRDERASAAAAAESKSKKAGKGEARSARSEKASAKASDRPNGRAGAKSSDDAKPGAATGAAGAKPGEPSAASGAELMPAPPVLPSAAITTENKVMPWADQEPSVTELTPAHWPLGEVSVTEVVPTGAAAPASTSSGARSIIPFIPKQIPKPAPRPFSEESEPTEVSSMPMAAEGGAAPAGGLPSIVRGPGPATNVIPSIAAMRPRLGAMASGPEAATASGVIGAAGHGGPGAPSLGAPPPGGEPSGALPNGNGPLSARAASLGGGASALGTGHDGNGPIEGTGPFGGARELLGSLGWAAGALSPEAAARRRKLWIIGGAGGFFVLVLILAFSGGSGGAAGGPMATARALATADAGETSGLPAAEQRAPIALAAGDGSDGSASDGDSSDGSDGSAGGEPAPHTLPLTIPDDVPEVDSGRAPTGPPAGGSEPGAKGGKGSSSGSSSSSSSSDRKDRGDRSDRSDKPEPKRPELDVEATFKAGQAEFLRGDAKAALATFRKITEAKPGFAPAWRGSALALERLGQKAAAARALRRYLKLAPQAGDAAQIKARLERLE